MTKESKESRYREYTSELISWLKEQIDKSPNKNVIVKVDDIVGLMGPIFKKDIGVYKNKKDIDVRALFELKYLLWPDEIVVDGAITKIGNALVFRRSTPTDEPPVPDLIETIGGENILYVKHIEVDVMSEDPFLMTYFYIEHVINDTFDGRGDIGISVTKIGDFKTTKLS